MSLKNKLSKLFESTMNEASYIRYASTDEQERAIGSLQRSLAKLGKQIVGATTIGKSPQTVILDLTYQGSEIYVDSDGSVEIKNISVNPRSSSEVGSAISPEQEKFEGSDVPPEKASFDDEMPPEMASAAEEEDAWRMKNDPDYAKDAIRRSKMSPEQIDMEDEDLPPGVSR